MARWIFAILLSVWGALAAAEATPEALEAAFRGWLEDVGAETAVLSVYRAGEEVHNVGIGMEPGRPLEIASLSKAITAVCVSTLIRDRVWTAETTSRAVLGFGPDGLSVAQLLTHSGGLWPDQTQGLMLLWANDPTPRAALAAKLALQRQGAGKPVGRYHYNNENYAVLGAMIAAETGQSFEAACRARALDPAGVQAKPSAIMGGMLAWGGWQMSASDYGRFHWHWFGPEGLIGRDAERWPRVTVGGPVQYGMGMFQREVGGIYNFWHFGAWCLPGGLQAGSYAVIWSGVWNVVAAYDRCVDFEQMAALDQALVAVVYRRADAEP